MTTKFIINDHVIFIPNENRITSEDNHSKNIALTAPASRCLLLLLEKQALVSQKELYEFAWGMKSQEVTPNNLYQNISILRKAFNAIYIDGKNLIITVPRKGFYFDKTAKVRKVTYEEEKEEEAEDTKSITIGLTTEKVRKRSFIISVLLTAIIAVTFIANKAISSNPYDSHYKFVESIAGCQADRKQSIDTPNNIKGQYCTAYPYGRHTQISKASTLSCQNPFFVNSQNPVFYCYNE
ncbi:MAG: winged helix-turn-helix domain-containing protein [Gibbsiella quercinecans]|uniref:winged helix-turn-helix domain-containing protein n=1 Tax=Gibbsiella quercinecans TaxID=929813 RepID=UPI003F392FA0